MSKIVISGYYGFANAGDEAMLTAIIKALRSTEKTVELTVISGNPPATAARHKVNSLHRFSFCKIFCCPHGLRPAAQRRWQSAAGRYQQAQSVILSVYPGFGPVAQKKVMLFGQGIGPIHNRLMRRLTKFICSRVDLITVRDQDSLYELRRIGVPAEKVQLTADSVLTLPQESKEKGLELLQQFGVPQDKMLIAISVRKWQEDDKYLLELAKAADILAREYKAHIVLLPLQYPVDVAACNRLQHFMRSKADSTVLATGCDTEQFLSLMGNFNLLIGMRLHALIFAAVMELPFVAVSYDPKIDGFVKDINGISAGAVETLQAAQVVASARKALASANAAHGLLDTLRAKAFLNAKEAFDLLN